MTDPLLSLRNVETCYGSIVALKGVDLEVHAGEVVRVRLAAGV